MIVPAGYSVDEAFSSATVVYSSASELYEKLSFLSSGSNLALLKTKANECSIAFSPLVGLGYLFSVLTGAMSSVSTLYESELINTIRISVTDSSALKKMERSVWDIVVSMLVAHLVES